MTDWTTHYRDSVTGEIRPRSEAPTTSLPTSPTAVVVTPISGSGAPIEERATIIGIQQPSGNISPISSELAEAMSEVYREVRRQAPASDIGIEIREGEKETLVTATAFEREQEKRISQLTTPAYVEVGKEREPEIKMQTTTQPISTKDVVFGKDDSGFFVGYSIFPTPPTSPLTQPIYSGGADIEAGAFGIKKAIKSEIRFGLGVVGGMGFTRYAPPIVQTAAKVVGVGSTAYSVKKEGVVQTALSVAAHPELLGFAVGTGTGQRPVKPIREQVEFVGRPSSPTRVMYAAHTGAVSGPRKVELDVMGESAFISKVRGLDKSISRGVYSGKVMEKSSLLSRLMGQSVFRSQSVKGRYVSGALQKTISPAVSRTLSVVRSSLLAKGRETELPKAAVASTIKKFGEGRMYDVYGIVGRGRGTVIFGIGKIMKGVKRADDVRGMRLSTIKMGHADVLNVARALDKNIITPRKPLRMTPISRGVSYQKTKPTTTALTTASMPARKTRGMRATITSLSLSRQVKKQQRTPAQSLLSYSFNESMRKTGLGLAEGLMRAQQRKQQVSGVLRLRAGTAFKQPTPPKFPTPKFPNFQSSPKYIQRKREQIFKKTRDIMPKIPKSKQKYTLSYWGLASGLKVRKIPKIIGGIEARFPLMAKRRRRRRRR